ncbi:accessory regulator [Romboutsia maritimum]|uniref:Accessory regulator n=2 Tax=Romboutsia maritimum TaxID=2020948 RepID=A0A371IR39_9FIRM|nr:accessory regulator [Romboutsia maritimum]
MMIKSYANKITSFLICNEAIDSEEYGIYTYGFEVLFASIINLTIIIGTGIIFDKFLHTLVFLGCYCPIRQFAGGYHADNHKRCILNFFCIFLLTIVMADCLDFIGFRSLIIFIAILNSISIYILAPIEHRNNPLSDAEKTKFKKITRILTTLLLMTIIISIHFGTLYEYTLYGVLALFWINVMLILTLIKK